MSEDARSPCHVGDFALSIPVMGEDTDLLKLMSCIRIKDRKSCNFRTDVLACGAVRMDRLLMGREEKVRLTSVFDAGNFTEVTMRAINADQFDNARDSLLPVDDTPAGGLPRIRFAPSVMWRMDELASMVDLTSDTLKLQMDKCSIKGPSGGEMFLDGMTRWGTRALNQCLCVFSLCMGTPGYALMPLLTPCVPRPVGSSAAPRSRMAPSPSPRSSRITRS
jgi:hypothetical protein